MPHHYLRGCPGELPRPRRRYWCSTGLTPFSDFGRASQGHVDGEASYRPLLQSRGQTLLGNGLFFTLRREQGHQPLLLGGLSLSRKAERASSVRWMPFASFRESVRTIPGAKLSLSLRDGRTLVAQIKHYRIETSTTLEQTPVSVSHTW